MDESLGSILANETAPVEAAPVEVQKDVKPVEEAKPEIDTAAPSAAKEVIQPTEAKKEPLKPAEIAAIMDERRKRQEAERQLAELRKQIPEEKTDFFTDPEKAVQEQVQKAVAPIREKFIKQSIAAATSAHADFVQAAEVFEEMLKTNPVLADEWLASDDPGEFIYSTATNTPKHREQFAQELKGQLAERDAKIAALSQELEAVKKAQAELAAVPKSLNNVASGSPPKAQDVDDDDLSKIVRFKSG